MYVSKKGIQVLALNYDQPGTLNREQVKVKLLFKTVNKLYLV